MAPVSEVGVQVTSSSWPLLSVRIWGSRQGLALSPHHCPQSAYSTSPTPTDCGLLFSG